MVCCMYPAGPQAGHGLASNHLVAGLTISKPAGPACFKPGWNQAGVSTRVTQKKSGNGEGKEWRPVFTSVMAVPADLFSELFLKCDLADANRMTAPLPLRLCVCPGKHTDQPSATVTDLHKQDGALHQKSWSQLRGNKALNIQKSRASQAR